MKNITFKTNLLILIIAILLLVGCQLNKEKATCQDKGGKWIKGGIDGEYYCVYTFADGGKACSDSSECQGRCLVSNPIEYACNTTKSAGLLEKCNYPTKNPKAYCKYDDSPYGCSITIESFREGNRVLCAD